MRLGDLTAEEAIHARARYGIPEGSPADSRHPLTLRLLAEVRAALADAPQAPDARADRHDVLSAHLDLMCLRVAVRLAVESGLRGTAVRRLAARVSGQVHEAARRSLGPGQGELDREAFEAVFPWGPARPGSAGAGWASAVLAEGILVPAGTGYRFAHEELADWLHGTHLDLDAALRALVHDHRPHVHVHGHGHDQVHDHGARPGTDRLPVPHHRIGPVVQAMLLLARRHGPGPLASRLADLVHALDADPGSWWAARLLTETLARVPDAAPYAEVLRLLADRVVAWRQQRKRTPRELGPAFWTALPLPLETGFELLRRLVHADGPPGETVPRFLDAAARLFTADPVAVLPHLVRWFEDERPLPATPHATVATAAQALLHTHRHRAGHSHRGARRQRAPAGRATARRAGGGGPLGGVQGRRPVGARRAARTPRGSRGVRTAGRAAHPRRDRPHPAAVRGPRPAGAHRRPAPARRRARPPGPGSEQQGPPPPAGPGPLRGRRPAPPAERADRCPHHPPGARPRGLPREARPPGRTRDAAHPRRRHHARPGPPRRRAPADGGGTAAGPRGRAGRVRGPAPGPEPAGHADHDALLPLLTGLLEGGPQPLRAALAGVLAGPGTPASRPLRRELLDPLLTRAPDPAVLAAVLGAAARCSGTTARELVHRTGLLLARTPDGAAHFDSGLVDLGRRVPGFAAALAHWLAEAPRSGPPWWAPAPVARSRTWRARASPPEPRPVVVGRASRWTPSQRPCRCGPTAVGMAPLDLRRRSPRSRGLDKVSTRSRHSAALAWLGGHPQDWGRSVVTIGSYDGVHRGHQLIIRHAVDRARELGVPAVVVTFDPHPSEVVRPAATRRCSPAPPPRRADGRAGGERGPDPPVHHGVLEAVTGRIRGKVLVDRLHAKAVVEGPNFRFGHRAAGTVEFLAEQGKVYDFEVEVVDLHVTGEAGGGEPFSSTLTRRLITEGDVEGAAEILGRPHRVEGVVVRGAQRGRELGFPTANVETLPHTAIPADGVYAGWLHAQGEVMPAAISVGTNPQFDGTERTVEAYAIDRVGLDLYGLHVAVDFLAFVRGQARFDTLEDLMEQMAADVRRCAELVAAAGTA
ncbi:bifunctional riboflavin kinase/FAD synthetase [Streptomyces sp. INA 01156]